MTSLYEVYWDFCNGSSYTFYHHRDWLHEKYGPIVRIGPNEVHTNDVDWFDTLYAGPASIRDKDLRAARASGSPLSIFGTADHHQHRRRRAAISKLLSKPVVQQNERVQRECFERLCDIIREQATLGEPVELRVWFLAYATDVLTCYSHGESMGLLKDRQQAEDWRKVVAALAKMTFLFRHFPWLLSFSLVVPLSFWKLVSSTMTRAMALHHESREAAQLAKDKIFGQPIESEATQRGRRPTIYHEIMASDLPVEEKSVDRLSDEAMTLLPAGTETTSRVLVTTTFYVLATDGVLPKLKRELDCAIPDPASIPLVKDLEQLPYLTAVIRESLRVAMVLVTGFALISPIEPLEYKGWTMPSGTRMSMTHAKLMMQDSVYPDPWKFDPERFLPGNPGFERNMRHLIAFSGGNRACYGQHLAMNEIYLVIAGLFRRFDFEPFDTVFDRDIKVVRDCFIGETSRQSAGLRVKVRTEYH